MTHPAHQRAIDALAARQALHPDDPDVDVYERNEQTAHDEWADVADELGVCLTCEAPSLTHAYCEDCR